MINQAKEDKPMSDYIAVLEARAVMEGITLPN